MPSALRRLVLPKKEIGARVRAMRLERGLSQVELAKLLGSHQTALSQIEVGRRGVSVQQVVKLARALQVTTDEILGESANGHGRLADRRLAKQIQKIEKLSRRQKHVLLATIDNFLKGAGAS